MRRLIFLGLPLSCLLILQTVALEPAVNPTAPEFLIESDKNDQNGSTPATHVADQHLNLIEQGLGHAIPRLQPREAMVLLAALKDRVESLIESGNKHPAFSKDEPKSLAEFEKLFWNIHVYSNQMAGMVRFFDYALALKPTALKYQPKASEEKAIQVSRFDWTTLKSGIEDLQKRFGDRERELRVNRLRLADKIMTESKNSGDKLHAALAIDLDSQVLLAQESSTPNTSQQNIQGIIQHAKQVAGPEFITKARALFEGLHWWFRGRYGMASEGGGLLKDARSLQSPDLMFGLYMPVTTPVPTAPQAGNSIPQVDRRHHYLWQFESRKFTVSTTTTTVRQIDAAIHGAVYKTMSFY